jgi:hypothetical protein
LPVAGIEPALVLALQNRMAGDPLNGFEDTDLFGIDLNLDRSAPGAVRHAVEITVDGWLR